MQSLSTVSTQPLAERLQKRSNMMQSFVEVYLYIAGAGTGLPEPKPARAFRLEALAARRLRGHEASFTVDFDSCLPAPQTETENRSWIRIRTRAEEHRLFPRVVVGWLRYDRSDLQYGGVISLFFYHAYLYLS